MTSKRPTDQAFSEFLVRANSLGSQGNGLQGAFDVGGPVTSDHSLLYRFVGVGKVGDGQIDFLILGILLFCTFCSRCENHGKERASKYAAFYDQDASPSADGCHQQRAPCSISGSGSPEAIPICRNHFCSIRFGGIMLKLRCGHHTSSIKPTQVCLARGRISAARSGYRFSTLSTLSHRYRVKCSKHPDDMA